MQTKKRFSLNWGKGAVIILMMTAILALFVLGAVSHFQVQTNAPVAVDWGSGVTTSCPPDTLDCGPSLVAVDWGNKTAK